MKLSTTLLALALVTLSFAQDRPPIKADQGQIQALAARMNALTSTNWQDGFAFGQELADLPSPLGYQIMRDNWTKGASLESRKQMFKGFVFAEHPDSLLVLNIGMNDPHLSMQAWSMAYLKQLFLVDFSTNFAAYPAWFESMKALPLKEVKQKSLYGALDAVLGATDAELSAGAAGVAEAVGATKITGYPKMGQLMDRLVNSPASGIGGAALASKLIASGSVPKEEGIAMTLKLLDRPEAVAGGDTVRTLVKMDSPELRARFIELAKKKAVDGTPGFLAIIDALLEAEEPTAPSLIIGLMPSLGNDMRLEISSTLANRFGVRDPQMDAAAWKAWLEANRARFETKYDPSKLPSFKIDAVPTAEYIPDAEDVKAIPSKAFFVGEDPMKRYFVSGKMEPGKTKNVLVVMPGGDGSPEFHPFVKRIQMNVLDDSWIVVQPIAPKWDNNEDRVVWPSAGSPYPAAKFTMETFLDGMFDELKTRHKLSVGKTYMLGWSSSGPSIYSYAGHGKHTIDGAFVAMSIFRPELFGGAKKLAIKRFYLLHSPQDFIKMSNPEAAKSTLETLKVPVTLTTYQGGHGWHGPVFDTIAQGMAFLKK